MSRVDLCRAGGELDEIILNKLAVLVVGRYPDQIAGSAGLKLASRKVVVVTAGEPAGLKGLHEHAHP
jgi:hypothetical protein